MKELFASGSNGMIGLLFFFVVFCAVLIWVFRPGSKGKYEHSAEIPLRKDDENE